MGLVASLVLPALSSAKRNAITLRCRNNHRQLVLGWIQYAHDNEGLMPNVDGLDRLPYITNWVAGDIQRPPGSDATNSSLLVDKDRSLMAYFITTPTIYKCPSDRSLWVRSVSMNCRLNPTEARSPPGFVGGLGTNFETFRNIEGILKSSDIFVTIDERFDSINDGYFAVDMTNTGTIDGDGMVDPYYWVDTPASYHNRSAVLSFADGHVESHQWLEPMTWSLDANGIRQTSSNDRDIRWLQDHTTYRK
jgi:prepilin-type processing-associated H-X9-DG protein